MPLLGEEAGVVAQGARPGGGQGGTEVPEPVRVQQHRGRGGPVGGRPQVRGAAPVSRGIRSVRAEAWSSITPDTVPDPHRSGGPPGRRAAPSYTTRRFAYMI
ncbi:hypothetical protein Kpho02_50230 [Kitasatospora phosalacinea]|uniref:Uncharacterized protein n=1 Tax=Kitasatospora phosalacinea TaxID=2065 RepID=A0A9W6V242_9ACTN|nr:hypothetical protein Kpho02_50230 [Kitasatospora phosalacinea]